MIRTSYLLWISTALLITLFPNCALGRSRNSFNYDGQLNFGAQMLHVQGGCLFVDGTVSSGDFFTDLERLDRDGEFAYRKGRKIVMEYPDTLTTWIRLTENQCGAETSTLGSASWGGNSYKLQFVAAWKSGMDLRPAIIISRAAHCIASRNSAAAGDAFASSSVACQLIVQGKGVPITDHLIVSVFGPDSKPLTRLSAAP